MNQAQLEALLGRPLTSIEVTNLELYLEIANDTLETLLCTSIRPATEERTFNLREGYRTAFVDIFTEVTEVKVNGTVQYPTSYSKRQWDKRTGGWFNSLVLADRITSTTDEITVNATWGFVDAPVEDYAVPSDLQVILAGLFSLITKKNKLDPTVTSKATEDFKISFNADVDLDEEFYTQYSKTIDKYSLCNIGYVRHGEVC